MGLLHEIVHVDDKLILHFYVVSTLMFMWIVRLSSCEAFGPFFLRPTTLRTKALAWLTLRRKKSPHTPCFPRLDTDRRPLGSSDTLRSALSTRNNFPQYHLHNNRHCLANIIISYTQTLYSTSCCMKVVAGCILTTFFRCRVCLPVSRRSILTTFPALASFSTVSSFSSLLPFIASRKASNALLLLRPRLLISKNHKVGEVVQRSYN